MSDVQETGDFEAVKKVIGRFSRAFAQADGASCWELWDQEYSAPVYQPEEIPNALLKPAKIKAYLMKLPEILESASDIRPVEFNVDVLDGGFAHAYARAWVSLSFHQIPGNVDGEVRQSFVLRKHNGAWRVIHYHESRLTPGFEDVMV